MRLSDILQDQKRLFSFEFFPPKTPAGERTLFKTIDSLKDLEPSFVSVTCGAGGSTRAKTVEWATRIKTEIGLVPLVHMTCLGVPQNEIDATLDGIQQHGLTNILALRGDPPESGLTDGPCHYASELIAHIKATHPEAFVAGACYPEVHTDAPNFTTDLQNLKKKADAGAELFITQLFFDNRHYYEFVGRARTMGITQPIIPGIMPIQNVGQTKRFTEMCGATLPQHLLQLLDQYQVAPSAVFHIGVAHAIAQATDLLTNGAPGIHFYTLNKSPATRLVVEALKKDGF